QGQPRPQGQARPQGQGQPRPQGQGQPRPQGQARPQGQGQPRPQGQARPQGQPRPQGQARPQGQGQPRPQGQRPAAGRNMNDKTDRVRINQSVASKKKSKKNANKKRNKIILFIAEILVLLIILIIFWFASQASKIQKVVIDDEKVKIDEQVIEAQETGAMKGYRNIALFGVDSRDQQLDKNTRTDTIMIASINMDTKEVKLVSVYRDTWLNMSTDSYDKANAAYAKGGPAQAISMLNMNLDMNITDFVTCGFEALEDVIDAVGGIEIDVTQDEIVHLNSYQICLSGEPDGTLNAAGEPNYKAREGIDYIPVTKPGKQKLNGLQATAYCRIRYVGNDYARTSRQRTVLMETAKKAITLNPVTLNKIAEAVFPKIKTSLEMTEILELISGIAGYKMVDQAAFPFDGYVQGGRVGSKSIVAPVDLEENVKLLHKFFFADDTEYQPSDTVKRCSKKIVADTGISYNP
ncbi:MAG: LCP family protein, partial [Lachnospiraceae bacterium]|nr:LCP family protein [Lachnospiraceae bacterium]